MNLPELSSTTLLRRAVRYPLSILPRGLVVPILQGPLKGKKWIVGSQRHVCWLGIYESHLQRVVALEVKQGGVFYDVGANVGFYSLLASMLIGPGKVFAFEPVPTNIDYLSRHLALNEIKNVEVLDLAISDEVGTSLFHLDETRAMGRLQADGDYRVRTATLDSLIHEGKVAPPDYIKMDIEGAEFRALMGARVCFERYWPLLFLATHGREVHRQCCRLLESWGYEYQVLRVTDLEDRAEVIARRCE